MKRLKTWYDPRLYGPHSKELTRLRALSMPASAAAAFLALTSLIALRDTALSVALAVGAFLVWLTPSITIKVRSYILSSGIEAELPAALALLIPYAASSRDLANLLIYAARELRLRFLGQETWRLEALLSTGMDERGALRFIADTSPSQRLRAIVRELLGAEELGVPRSRLVATIYSRALEMVRQAWSGYVRTGEVIVEGVITLVASTAILVPLVAFGGLQAIPILAALAAALSGGSALALILMRPSLGDLEGGWDIGSATLTSALLSSLLLSKGYILTSIALLAPAALYSELANVRAARGVEQAVAKLREAATRARLGLSFDEHLRLAAPAGGRLVEAAAKAYRIAGRVGLGGAMESFADLVSDALRLVSSVKLEGTLLEAISAAVPAVSAIALRLLTSYVMSTAIAGGLGLTPLYSSMGVLAFIAPLAPLPASALQRGRRLSAAPSLASVLIYALALRLT